MLTAEGCSKSELELFTIPPHNVSMERGDYAVHKPLAQISHSTPLEFHVQASPNEYIDLGRTKLQLTLRIAKRSGEALGQDARVTTANLLLHTLFSRVDCKLNGMLVTANVDTYPYKAYLETILSHGSASSKSWLQAELYEEDDPCNDNYDPTARNAQPGIKKRNERIKESRIFQLTGRPHVDIFMQDKYLLPGVDIDLKFTQSPTRFHLLGGAVLRRVQVEIIGALLLVRNVKVNPDVSLAHIEELQKGIPATYPLRRGVVTTFVVPAGTRSFNRENLIIGQLPRRVFLGLVTNTTFNGSGRENPFNFRHFSLNYLALSSNDQTFPHEAPLTPYFRDGCRYAEVLSLLYQAVNVHNSNRGLVINYDNYARGYTLYGFDLTTDMCEGAHTDPIKHGALKLEAHFGTDLTRPINVICYAEYDNTLRIDGNRNVLVDYATT